MWRDARYAVRSVIASPGLAIAATLTLAVASAAAAAVLALLNGVILKPLPVDRPRELVLFSSETGDGVFTGTQGGTWILFSNPSFEYFRSQQRAFTDVCAVQAGRERFAARFAADPGEQAYVTRVSGNYFAVIGARSQLGRMLQPGDDRRGAAPVVVLSDAFWTRRFARNPAVIGDTLTLGATAHTIVGVAARGFFGETMRTPPDVWAALAANAPRADAAYDDHHTYGLMLIGRLRSGVTIADANAQMNALLTAFLLEEAGPQPTPERQQEIAHTNLSLVRGDLGRSPIRGRAATPLTLLAILVGLLLATAAINVASLLVARAAHRERTTAVHLMLGASRGHVMRGALVETCCFVGPGVLAGIVMALLNPNLLLPLLTTTPLPLDLHADGRLALMLGALCIAAIALSSVGPVWSIMRAESGYFMFRNSGTAAPSRSGHVLVAAQVALAVPLLLVAGLLLRSVDRLEGQELAVDREHVLIVDFGSAPVPRDRIAAARKEMLDAVRAHAGVASATFASQTPFGGDTHASSLMVEGRPPREDRSATGAFVGPRYFRTLGLPLLAGRDFTEDDDAAHPKVIILSETAARTFLPGEDPIGRRVAYGSRPPAEVIGVARDVKFGSLRGAPPRQVFIPQLQYGPLGGRLVVRLDGAAGDSAAPIRDAIRRAATNMPIQKLGTLDAEIRAATATERVLATTATLLAAATLLVCGLGVCGLMAYLVARRTREIGIRMALGATSGAVMMSVLLSALRVAVVGAIVGAAGAMAGARIVQSLLYEVRPADPLVMTGVSVLILVATLIAGLWPARRAGRVDPLTALRADG